MRDAGAHRHRLDLVVGDVQGRHPDLAMEPHQLGRVCVRNCASKFDVGLTDPDRAGGRLL
jgi:hypothetical protein